MRGLGLRLWYGAALEMHRAPRPNRYAKARGRGRLSPLALRLLRLIVNIRLDGAVATGRALGSMAHGCDRSSAAFTTVHRTASPAARGGSAAIK
jgi:hypothetical protein